VKLLVVIVNYKVTPLTIDCLRSLAPQIGEVPGGCRVAVCENGTGPEAAAELRAAIDREGWSDWVDLTVIYPNRGFTGGNNAILRPALEGPKPPEYFYLLNADTIARPGALRALVEFMDGRRDVGIAGSRLESREGVPRSTAFRFLSVPGEFERAVRFGPVSYLLRRWEGTGPLPAGPTATDWTSGAALCVRRVVFEEVGLLDEDLYTYFDDIDLCLRARRAGWPTWLVPDSHVVHLMGQSTGITQRDTRPKRRPTYWFQARRHFWLKNYGPLKTALADAAWITGFALWRLRRFVQRLPDNDPPYLLIDAIRHSVFVTGFRQRPVPNPALADSPA
jgi:GT2 family glycosyltransferase